MLNPRPTIPLVPELADLRLRRRPRGADDQLFPGFGVGIVFGSRGMS